MDKLKIIKAVVVFFTFLLVFGMLSALGIIYKKVHKQTPLQDIEISQPAGSYIESFQTDGSRLFVLIKGGHRPDRIILLNSGEISSLKLKQE